VLMTTPIAVIANGLVATAQEEMEAEVEVVDRDIMDRYPIPDCCIKWQGRKEDLAAEWKKLYGKDPVSEEAPINKCDTLGHIAVEYEGGRVAIVYPNQITWNAMIIEGKE